MSILDAPSRVFYGGCFLKSALSLTSFRTDSGDNSITAADSAKLLKTLNCAPILRNMEQAMVRFAGLHFIRQAPNAESLGNCRRRAKRRNNCHASLALPVVWGDIAAKGLALRLDSEVLFTSLGASINLVSACAFVAWTQKSGLLPAETPVILSQVAFRITIPCYLMIKVSTILATQASGSILVVPFLAVGQILIGAVLGKVFCMILYGGQTGATANILTRTKLAKKEALVTTACAFGNTLTLPLVFLSGILPPKDATVAAGYLGLFMVGWSPALWVGAYQILSSVGGNQGDGNRGKVLDVVNAWCRRIFNPPVCGVLIGMFIGLTPVSKLLMPQKLIPNDKLLSIISRLLRPVYDAVALLGSAAPAVQLTVLACTLAGVMKSRRMPRMKVKSASVNLNPEEKSSEKFLMERKEFLAICCVRSLLVPLVFSITMLVIERLQLLTVDPICKLTLLVLSAMPPAQNLVVLAQLRPSTRPLAREIANILLIQYVAALVPVTLWMAIFLSTMS